jgi:CheY-like chemotaxis protein
MSSQWECVVADALPDSGALVASHTRDFSDLQSPPSISAAYSSLTAISPEPSRISTASLLAPSADPRVVLVVEDSEPLRILIRLSLESANFNVLEASSAEQALRVARRSACPIDLLITDVNLPGHSGADLAATLHAEMPSTSILFISGRPGTEWGSSGHGSSGQEIRFLQKPFSRQELIHHAQQLLQETSGSRV